MRLFFKLIFLLVVLSPFALGGLLYPAIETQPTIASPNAEITPASIERAKRIVEQNDPRKLKSGERRTISTSASDLDLAADGGGPLADAVGLYKEVADSRGGSGFSFNDIAADRAGSRFGEHAAQSANARTLQKKMRAGISERDIMPSTADLPEFTQEAELKRRFGGIDAPEYKKLLADIDRRIAALPLYR
jgi:hypothetical protein